MKNVFNKRGGSLQIRTAEGGEFKIYIINISVVV